MQVGASWKQPQGGVACEVGRAASKGGTETKPNYPESSREAPTLHPWFSLAENVMDDPSHTVYKYTVSTTAVKYCSRQGSFVETKLLARAAVG